MSHTNAKSLLSTSNFATMLHELIKFHEFILIKEMESLYYVEEMAEAEREKPVDDETSRETVWFERARKMRTTARRILDKHVKLIEKLPSQASKDANEETSAPSLPQEETKAHAPSHANTQKSSKEIFESLIKRREIYRDPSVPAGQVWLGYDEGTPEDESCPRQTATGEKVQIDSDLSLALLLKDRKLYYCAHIQPGEIWMAIE